MITLDQYKLIFFKALKRIAESTDSAPTLYNGKEKGLIKCTSGLFNNYHKESAVLAFRKEIKSQLLKSSAPKIVRIKIKVDTWSIAIIWIVLYLYVDRR